MIKYFIQHIKGDKTIWAIIGLLALISFMPVYSSSTNLAYTANGGSTVSYVAKHFIHILLGFFIIYQVHKINYHYLRKLSLLLLPVMLVLLAYTLLKGTEIGGINASRWINIPYFGITFQTSAFAFILLMIYVARYLTKTNENRKEFKHSLVDLWLPVFLIIGLIFPANFSTAAIMFSMVIILVFIGNYPLKHLTMIFGLVFVTLLFFVLVAKAFPNKLTSRVNTWESRIEKFVSGDDNQEEQYQIERAKTAVASGGLYGLGPGKSVQRNFLPQSSSDFIYAIIVEEYGLLGGLFVVMLFIILLLRFIIGAHKAKTTFGKLLIIGLGFPIILQAIINMGVAVGLFPVTGQTLPFISSGGSSIWAACMAIGIILNVTKKDEEIVAEEQEKEKREKALNELIEKHLQANDEQSDNPLTAINN